jgi:multidrug efflux pump subunit AcrB
VSEMLATATSGGLGSLLPRVTLGNEQIPIRTRIAGGDRVDLQRALDLPVPTETGDSVPLRSIATLVPRETEAGIRRLDRERVVDLSANLDGLTLSEAIAAIQALPAYARMPAQVRMADYGESQYMNEMFVQFGLAVLLGLGAVYAVLVLLFRDWLQPVTIMLALPLSLGGAALALLLTGHSLNISTVIGLLMLFGIVGKNSILLVDYIVEARAAGAMRDAAVRQAGRERVRPILMTTVAMVGGMLPAAVGFGQDDGFRAPMAIAVIGGLIASTLLSLLLVPMAYAAMDDFEHWLRRWRKGRTEPATTMPAGHREPPQ